MSDPLILNGRPVVYEKVEDGYGYFTIPAPTMNKVGHMSTKRLLAALALVLAVLSLVVSGYPLLTVAVLLLALSELV